MSVIYVKNNGSVKTTEPDKTISLQEAQDYLGGYVEMVPNFGNDDQMMVNESGLLENLPYNPTASEWAGRDIVGPMIVLTGKHRWT